jgi:hypothetical protein
MHCGSHRYLHRLQIHTRLLALIRKHDLQQPCDLRGYFLLDRFGRFFSSGAPIPAGRARQIRVLKSTNSRLKS